ncbi:unnamed protein product [Didymodactylos carnosus]|uniref:Cupin type-1 domain-containing protein n=1 Tax=Didymodactylos carnosus TaxID=1234261 RepID=A0A8S2FF55_9BILA|nr:unnamed protein product [Didymodactylos carnosus]CAF4245589.1 unnamed protein product [Didymodactylos carnosus]
MNRLLLFFLFLVLIFKLSYGNHPYLYHLTSSAPIPFSGGVLRGANQEVFPILTGQFGSVYYAILKPNAIRNPHWHPIAWEFNYVISGRVRWTIVGPQNKHDSFEAKTGDLVFIPQGYFHYFENIDDKYDLVLWPYLIQV